MPGYKGMHRYRTTEEFLFKLKEYLKEDYNNYDFSKVEYKGCKSKVKIICKKCNTESVICVNEVLRLAKNGKILCTHCRHILNKFTIPSNDEYKIKLFKIYGNLYDYSKVNYVNSHAPITLICKKHNYEITLPAYYFNIPSKYSLCPLCKKEEMDKNHLNHFIELFNKRHPDLIGIYSNIHFIENRKIEFECPVHGTVQSAACTFLERGCRKCNRKNTDRNYTPTEFVTILKEIYKDKYDYSKVEYKTFGDKVCLICPKHGEFWRLPPRLLEGRGCPKCKESLLENELINYLDKLQIHYIYQYRNRSILGQRSIDFYFPQYSAGIECQGKQHFDKDSKFNENVDIEEVYKNDKYKYDICLENGIKIYYFSHSKPSTYQYIDKIYTNKETLINSIINNHEQRLLSNT